MHAKRRLRKRVVAKVNRNVGPKKKKPSERRESLGERASGTAQRARGREAAITQGLRAPAHPRNRHTPAPARCGRARQSRRLLDGPTLREATNLKSVPVTNR